MILKLGNMNGKWELIDGFDRINYEPLPEGKPLFDDGEVVEKFNICLYKDGKLTCEIKAARPIYILDNNGTTVERI